MRFHILTLFPDMVMDGLNTSILGRAMERSMISAQAINIRDYSEDKHHHVDDTPYGGGAGMVMQAGPVYRAYEDLCKTLKKRPRVIYTTPQGKVFNQTIAKELAKEEDLVFLCGHYEGIDERALELIATDYLSIGDYVLTGGELPSMVMIDCISRLVPGVLNNEDSAEFESFHDNLLEYPQYTRPEVFMGRQVPEVLLTGHHKNIDTWRRQTSIERTLERRPDLLKDAVLSLKEQAYLEMLLGDRNQALRGAFQVVDLTHTVCEHMPVYPGTEPPTLSSASEYETDGFRETHLSMFSHTGTHMDAPAHLFKNRTALDQYPASQFVGRALTIDVSFLKAGEPITMDVIEPVREKADQADFLLFYTGWDRYWGQPEYFEGYPCIDGKVANYLLKSRKKGVGVDAIGIDPVEDTNLTIHKKLLKHQEFVIVENLRGLEGLTGSLCTFLALPLKFQNADGAPVRAIALMENV